MFYYRNLLKGSDHIDCLKTIIDTVKLLILFDMQTRQLFGYSLLKVTTVAIIDV